MFATASPPPHSADTPDPRALRRVGDPRLDGLWRHWLAARKGRLMPARRSIDPIAMPMALPHLFLDDFHADTGRFHCRLSGEEINLVVACETRHPALPPADWQPP
ncbi:MAG: PAS domain-containing protein [Alphaproteobacteria bacterium]|nr:PAS domain-containing protein [Alphaproteobacteria bacterium]